MGIVANDPAAVHEWMGFTQHLPLSFRRSNEWMPSLRRTMCQEESEAQCRVSAHSWKNDFHAAEKRVQASTKADAPF